MTEMNVVGQPHPAVGSREIVTGHARYTADLAFPGMLIGKILYSAHPSARILHLGIERAKAMPGVVVLLTHADVPGKNSFLYSNLDDQPLFVSDVARYQGDVLAAVAAENETAASAALMAIEVEYEPLPGVFDPLEAMKETASRVWPDRSNVCGHTVIERGDIEQGFEQADVIIENTYTTQYVEHAFLETESAVARIDDDGTIVVYICCQTPHRDRLQIARALSLPENMIRVITPYIGGAFGGKDEAHVQIYAALLAQAARRPVRIVRTREESIQTHVKRHPVTIYYRSGVTRDGLLTAIHVKAIGDTGPYVTAGTDVMAFTAVTENGPYYVPNARMEAYTVLTNNPLCGAMRGFGIPQAAFACERQMDELANAIGMDPLEIRLRNGLETGSLLPTGAAIREGKGMKACLLEAARIAGWGERNRIKQQPEPHLRRGWGMASIIFSVGMGRNIKDFAGASLEMSSDGSVILRTGAADMGQGVHTALAQMAAQSLGVKLSSIKVITPDTEVTTDAGPSTASRQTYISGNAVLNAAAPIRRALLETAAEETGLPVDSLSLEDNWLYADGERLNISIAHLAQKALASNRQLHAEGHYAMEYMHDFPPDGYPYAPEVFTFGTQVAKVLVDIETGEVKVEELVIVQDAGRVINPGGAKGQIEGGAAMGFGYAVMEELLVEQGRTLNNALDSFLIPTSKDIPKMTTKILEIPEPLAPFGAKGIGESTLTPTAPAIANAVSNAIGVPINHLPLTAENVLKAIGAKYE